MKTQRPLTISILIVLLLSLCNTQSVWTGITQHWHTSTRPSWIVPPGQTIVEARADPDTVLIHGGLIQAPRFRDTFRWWTGTWAGQVPFYRPLPSLLFWGEWKLYGDWENRYALFPLLFYFLALYQFLRLASDLFVYVRCPWPAIAILLSGLIFIDGLGMFPLRSMTSAAVMVHWKNQVDSVCAVFFFLSLRAYLRVLSHRAPVHRGTRNNAEEAVAPSSVRLTARPPLRALWAALGWYLASCGSKEAGVVLPLLLIGLEAPALLSRQRPQVRAALLRLAPFLTALPLFLLYRTWCLGTAVGFQYGSNGSWRGRLLSSAFGPVSASAVMRQWPTLALCVVLAVLLWNVRTFWVHRKQEKPFPVGRSMALLSVLILGLILVNLPPAEPGASLIARVGGALLSYFVGDYVRSAFILSVFLVGAASGVSRCPLLAGVGYLWVLLELVMLAMSPSPPHRYYLLEGGYALWIGGGLAIFASEFAPTRLLPDRPIKSDTDE